jgi:beta-lactamase superfamily II metal-dependent hydrolase
LLIDARGLPFWMHSQMDIGEDVVSPYLWSRGISRLDAIAPTHAHQDHMGGLPAIIANFHPRELWLPEGIPSDEIRDLLATAEGYNVKVIDRKAGDLSVQRCHHSRARSRPCISGPHCTSKRRVAGVEDHIWKDFSVA